MMPDQVAVRDPGASRRSRHLWTDLEGRNLATDQKTGGFESLRARPAQRPVSLGGADLVRCQLVRTFESPDTPEVCRASWRSAIMTVWAMQRLPYGRRTLSSADCWKSISGLA
jgi:hypothetical protein